MIAIIVDRCMNGKGRLSCQSYQKEEGRMWEYYGNNEALQNKK